MSEDITYGVTPPLQENYQFRIVGLKRAEKIYEGERPNTEELVSTCDSCTQVIKEAREKGLGAKVKIEIHTNHLVGLV